MVAITQAHSNPVAGVENVRMTLRNRLPPPPIGATAKRRLAPPPPPIGATADWRHRLALAPPCRADWRHGGQIVAVCGGFR